jgi:hypothetical protein
MKKYIFIFIFIASLLSPGCFTYYPVNLPVDSLNFNDGRYYRIMKVFYQKGGYKNLENYDAEYFDKFGNLKRVIIYSVSDTLNRGISVSTVIPMDSIKSITLERRKNDLKSSILTGSIIIAVAAVLYIIGFSIALHSGKFRI